MATAEKTPAELNLDRIATIIAIASPHHGPRGIARLIVEAFPELRPATTREEEL